MNGRSRRAALSSAEGLIGTSVLPPLGRCHIIVEAAGPAVGLWPSATPPTLPIAPSSIKGMAGWVIRQCVDSRLHTGGFVTLGLGNLVSHINNLHGHSDALFCKFAVSSP